jgi:hypothetical protein
MPFLLRTDLAKLGLERRAVDAVSRACPSSRFLAIAGR